jgi:cytochrome c5
MYLIIARRALGGIKWRFCILHEGDILDFFSTFKQYTVVLCAAALLWPASSYADQSTSTIQATNPKLEIVDGYYAAYPQTSPGKDAQEDALIRKGEYLAKAGDCIACHTNVHGHTPAYAGRLPFATPFGTFYSPNITPDNETGIGLWTEADFIRALKEGRGLHGENYLPVFPFVYFANITDEDAHALYAYFRHIPAAHLENRSLPFPFNIPGARFTMWGWKLLFFYPNTLYKPDPAQSSEWNRGKYLVDGLGHCSMCHTPLSPLGYAVDRYYLNGGFIDGYWAPSINKAGLEGITEEEIVDVFSKNQLLNRAGPVAGPMSDVNHDSLRYLTREDQLAIATYLKTVVSDDQFDLPPAAQGQSNLSRGKQVYIKVCSICHQRGEMSAPVIGVAANWYQRAQLVGVPGLYKHAIDGYNSMPIKGACVTCSKDDIKAAVDFILDSSLTHAQRINLAAEH